MIAFIVKAIIVTIFRFITVFRKKVDFLNFFVLLVLMMVWVDMQLETWVVKIEIHLWKTFTYTRPMQLHRLLRLMHQLIPV